MLLSTHPFAIIRARLRIILTYAVLAALATGVLSLFFPLEYRADATVLVISKSRYGVDPYTVVRSAERIGENVVQVMRTDDFYEKVMLQPGYAIDRAYFEDGVTEQAKRKRWQRAVVGSVVYGTGVVNVSAFHTDREAAKALSGAIADALASRGWEYVGGDVAFKVVNPAVATTYPVRPNVLSNSLLGFFVGGAVMVFVTIRRYG